MLPHSCSFSNTIISKTCVIFPSSNFYSIQGIIIRKKPCIFNKAICTCKKVTFQHWNHSLIVSVPEKLCDMVKVMNVWVFAQLLAPVPFPRKRGLAVIVRLSHRLPKMPCGCSPAMWNVCRSIWKWGQAATYSLRVRKKGTAGIAKALSLKRKASWGWDPGHCK